MRKSGIPTYTPLRSGRKSDASFGTLSVQSNRISSGGYRRSMGRPSLLDSVRRSSAADNQGRKERLVIDPTTHQRNFQNLIAFLNDNHYDKPRSSVRCQGTNSSKEVSNIFLFLMGILCPSYVFTSALKKIEEEFPTAMKTLKYPYIITKSCFQPIGTPRYWPQVVNALFWMTSLVKYLQIIEKNSFKSFPVTTAANAKSASFKLNLATYHLLMADEDDKIFALEKQFFEKELESFLGVDAQDKIKMAELQATLNKHEEEIYKNKLDEDNLDIELLQLESDYHKLVKYNDEARVFIENVKISIDRKEKLIETNLKSIEEMQQSVLEKQTIVSSQKFTIYDVQRKKHQIEHLQSQVEAANLKYEQVLKEHNEMELDMMKKMEKIEHEISEYHSLASHCKIIPSSAENAKGYDYSIFVKNPKSESSPSNILDVKGRLKISLQQWKEANRSISVSILALKDDINKFQNMLASKDNQIITANSAFLRQEDALLLKEQEFKKVKKNLTCELFELEERISELKTMAKNNNVEQLEAKVGELRTKFKDMQTAFEKRVQEIKDCVLDMVTSFTEHKKYIEKTGIATANTVKEYCEKRNKNDELKFMANQKAIDDLREKAMRLHQEVVTTEAELSKFNVN